MRNKLTLGLTLVLMISLFMTGLSLADDTTSATVRFRDGELVWGDLDTRDITQMDLDFDEHELPTAEVSYDMTNPRRTLQVEDGRSTADGWNVKASLSEFDSGSHTFAGVIHMQYAETNHVKVLPSMDIALISNSILTPVDIASAASDAGRYIFKVYWDQPSQIYLSIGEPEAIEITLGNYEATLTWTLETGPA